MNLQFSKWHFAKRQPAKPDPRKTQLWNLTSTNFVVLNRPQYQCESSILQPLNTPSKALPSMSRLENVQYLKTSSSHPLGSSDLLENSAPS